MNADPPLPPSTTRSGKHYASYTLPSSFSLCAALQEAFAGQDAPPVHVQTLPSSLGSSQPKSLKRKAPPMGFDTDAEIAPAPADSTQTGPSDHSHPAALVGQRRKERRKEYKAKAKKMKHAQEFAANTRRPRKRDVARLVSEDKAIPTPLDIRELPADSSGYGATYVNAVDERREVLDMEDLKRQGFAVIEWDGREPFFIQEPNARKLVVIGVGIPEDKTYATSCQIVHELFLQLGAENEWEEGYVDHKRGKEWPAINMGVAYGFGNDPYNQSNNGHEDVVDELLSSPDLRRLAIHQSESLRFYVPRVFNYYHKRTMAFREANKRLKVNWDGSVYSSAACNLGPRVATFFHRDCMNLPFGFCAIHSLGNYDSTKGGHLVLRELKLIIQFPPGSLVLIPSATITHGNIPVREWETRTSFTQYTAGAVFRFVDNGFRSEKKFKKRDKKGYEKMMEEKPKRWEMGLGLWSTVDDLSNCRNAQ